MADPKVNIIVTAEDKASGVLKGIGGILSGGLQVGLMAGAAGLTALAGGLAYSVKEAMEAEEINAALAQVIKATGGAAGITSQMADNLANSLMGVTRYSDETIKSAETVLLRFKSIGRDTFPRATEMALDLATALGIDASSAAVMLGKALETPGEGMLRLKAAGVALDDETIALIKTMAESGDMAGAQALIMDALASSVGGAAKAAGDTFAGKLDIMKNTLSNVGEAIGTAVLPMLSEFAGQILTFVQSDQFQAWIAQVIEWLQVNLPIAIQFVSDVWTNVLQPAIAAIIPVLQVVMSGIAEFIATVQAWWSEHGARVMEIIQGIWDVVVTIFERARDTINNIIELFHLAQEGNWTDFGAKIREILNTLWAEVKVIFQNAINSIITFFTTTDWGAVGMGIIRGIANGISGAVQWLINAAVAAAKAALDAVKGFLGIDSPSKVFKGIGSNMMQGMALGIVGSARLPANAAANAASYASHTANNFTMNIQTNAQSSTLMRDFNFMRSMAG